jgi:hypothetical protein
MLTLAILSVAVCAGIVASTGCCPAEKPPVFVQIFSSGPALIDGLESCEPNKNYGTNYKETAQVTQPFGGNVEIDREGTEGFGTV